MKDCSEFVPLVVYVNAKHMTQPIRLPASYLTANYTQMVDWIMWMALLCDDP